MQVNHDQKETRPAIGTLGLEAADQELVSTRIELADSRSETRHLEDQLLQYLLVNFNRLLDEHCSDMSRIRVSECLAQCIM